MNYNLLFVDDETQILEGIEDSLRKYRTQWNMTFVSSGEDAIRELKAKNYDVIISDMQMAIVDGLEILKHVKQEYPSTIRIMLTGYFDINRTIDVSSLAHRYLSKPCDLKELVSTIQSSLSFKDTISDETIKTIAGTVDLLPVSNSQHRKFLKLIKSNDTHIGDFAQIIESDAALTTKILQLVNSSYFRRACKIETAKDAATYLGTDLIKSIALANQLYSVAEGNDSIDNYWLDRQQKHSWLTAKIAKHLLSDREEAEAAFTAALLHEIGSLALCVKRPDLFNPTIVSKPDVDNVDKTSLGVENSSMQVALGAYLLNLWGMPSNIVEAVAFHQQPSVLGRDKFDIVGAVHVANHLAEVCMQNEFNVELGENLDIKYLEALNLDHELNNWLLSAQLIVSDSDPSSTSTHSRNAA